MTTPITTLPITGFTILDLALVSPAAGQFLEVGGSSDGRVDIDALASYCRAGLAWSDLGAKPTTLAGYGITDAQPLDADLTALAGLATTGAIERTGAGTAVTFTVSAFAKTILDDADAATARGTLGLGTLATQAANSVAITGGSITGITDLAVADGGTGASTAAAARTNLGATTVGANLFTLPNPGAIRFPRLNADNSVSSLSDADFRAAINAQTANSNLGTLAALSVADGNFIVGNGLVWTVESGATARSSLGVGTAATANTGTTNGTVPLIGADDRLTVVSEWVSLTLTMGAKFEPIFDDGNVPTRARWNPGLRQLWIEFSIQATAVPVSGDTIFSWSSVSVPEFIYASIALRSAANEIAAYVDGSALKFQSPEYATPATFTYANGTLRATL
jgi:hypothetical protein